mgnify:CR=1 FL=1
MRPEDTKGDPVYNPAVDHERLVTLFRNWSDVEAVANLSPLYQLLGNAVADDAELLDLAGEALPGQPPPNVLFAAVHALLAHRPGHPLAAYYATLGGSRAAAPEAVGLFREFCLEHRDELLPAIRTRLVQTNEVRRSAILLPAFASVEEDAGQPLALFEIGPSAGLNLLFDRYRYRFGDVEIGPAGSPVVLESEPRGAVPALPIPAVASRCRLRRALWLIFAGTALPRWPRCSAGDRRGAHLPMQGRRSTEHQPSRREREPAANEGEAK